MAIINRLTEVPKLNDTENDLPKPTRESVVTLIKPHYEADPKLLRGGVLPSESLPAVVENTKTEIEKAGFELVEITDSPIRGAKGNAELLAHLRPAPG